MVRRVARHPRRPWAPRERLTIVTIEQHLAVEVVEPDGTPALAHLLARAARAPAAAARAGILASARRPSRSASAKSSSATAWLVGGMIVLRRAVLAAALGRRYVGLPLDRLIDKTRRIAAGDLSGPVRLDSRDELAELAESLNAMCAAVSESQARIREETAGRVAAVEQLRHADRLKTVGRLAAGIAHQLGTPLNVVSGRASLIASGKLTPERNRRRAPRPSRRKPTA